MNPKPQMSEDDLLQAVRLHVPACDKRYCDCGEVHCRWDMQCPRSQYERSQERN